MEPLTEAVAEVTPLPSSPPPRDNIPLLLPAIKRRLILDEDEFIVSTPAASTAMGERASLNPVGNQEAIQLPDKQGRDEESGCTRASDTREDVVPSDIMEPPTEAVAEATPLLCCSQPLNGGASLAMVGSTAMGMMKILSSSFSIKFISTVNRERATLNPVGNQDAVQLPEKPNCDKEPGCIRVSDYQENVIPPDITTEAVAELTPVSASSPPPATIPQLPQPAISRPRFPCYGWIGSDDDDNEFIDMTPRGREPL